MRTLIILSGGMDSATLAYQLKAEDHELMALSFDYGQRHARELAAASAIAQGLNIPHYQVALTGLMGLLSGSSLTDQRIDVPHGHYTAPTMKKTVVPGRNALMLALGWAVAAAQGMDRLAAAVHAGDHAIYPDCRADFIAALNHALILGTREVASENLELYTPFLYWSKTDIAYRGAVLGVPFHQTWTCYEGASIHCGRCGACVERQGAFKEAGIVDPTIYQDTEYAKEFTA